MVSDLILAAIFLDPRIKNIFDIYELDKAQIFIVNFFNLHFKEENTSKVIIEEKIKTITKEEDDYDTSWQVFNLRDDINEEKTLKDEIKEYRDVGKILIKSNVFDFWKKKQHEYQKL